MMKIRKKNTYTCYLNYFNIFCNNLICKFRYSIRFFYFVNMLSPVKLKLNEEIK